MKIKIIILSTFLFVLLLFGIPVKAESFGDIELDIPEQLQGYSLPYYVIFEDDSGFTHMYLSQNKTHIEGLEDDYDIVVNGPYVLYYWHEGKEKWDVSVCAWGDDATHRNSISLAIANNYDIYHENGAKVFRRAPIRVSFIETMKKIQMGAVMETVAKMIPAVMIAVAGFLGFRKAFNLLLRVLQGA